MTYRELRDVLNMLDDSQLDCDLTIHAKSSDEYYPVEGFSTKSTDGVLDEEHPYFVFTD